MKLELKHIAPYLPYELQFKTNSTGECYKSYQMNMLDEIFDEFGDYNISEIKPILRPMSDICENINGDIPLVEIAKIGENQHFYDPDFTPVIESKEFGYYITFRSKETKEPIMFCYDNKNRGFSILSEVKSHHDTKVVANMADVMQLCYKYHLDIHGLIDKGLAISTHDVDSGAR